jgi:hypothetical protein
MTITLNHSVNSNVSILDGGSAPTSAALGNITFAPVGTVSGDQSPIANPQLSIDELVAYLEMRLDNINDKIRGFMTAADKNNALTRGAGQLQSSLGSIGPNSTPSDLNSAANEIDKLLAAGAGSADLSDAQRQQLSSLSQQLKDRANALSQPSISIFLDGPGAGTALAASCSGMNTTLTTIVSESSHTDQANLANIQNLVSQMGQATNLVSNMVAAFNEGFKSIISNTRS